MAREKQLVMYKGTPIRQSTDFSAEILQARRDWHNTLKVMKRASLVAQWLRIRLPMQGTRVHAPVREDPTCHGATRPMSHNY